MKESDVKVAETVTKVESTTVTPVAPKKKFPVWAIVLIVIVFLCLCSGIACVASGFLATFNPSKNIEDAKRVQQLYDQQEQAK
jgi:hypothetical protein